jgi:hypothetical protein
MPRLFRPLVMHTHIDNPDIIFFLIHLTEKVKFFSEIEVYMFDALHSQTLRGRRHSQQDVYLFYLFNS